MPRRQLFYFYIHLGCVHQEEVVVSIEHILSLVATGESHRHVGSTNFNAESSRSHTIFQLSIESSVSNGDQNSPGVQAHFNTC
jgi:centromeric protein E